MSRGEKSCKIPLGGAWVVLGWPAAPSSCPEVHQKYLWASCLHTPGTGAEPNLSLPLQDWELPHAVVFSLKGMPKLPLSCAEGHKPALCGQMLSPGVMAQPVLLLSRYPHPGRGAWAKGILAPHWECSEVLQLSQRISSPWSIGKDKPDNYLKLERLYI